jgi:hypothetical protein
VQQGGNKMKKMSKYAVFKELNSPWQFIEAVSEKQAIYFAKKENDWEDAVPVVEGYHAIDIEGEEKVRTPQEQDKRKKLKVMYEELNKQYQSGRVPFYVITNILLSLVDDEKLDEYISMKGWNK